MKKWVSKLIEQFDFEVGPDGKPLESSTDGLTEDRATVLFMLDVFNKHLIEVEGHPVRKTREALDSFAKELIAPKDKADEERLLFRLRQFFSAYRIDETTYFQKTFEEFRTIIWDFVDQLSEDINAEEVEDTEIKQSLESLKEAVESNSIEVLKSHSRKFIDCYVEKQFKKDKRRSTRMKSIKKNLDKVKKQLGEAQDAARTDHLTGACNRKTFDEQGANLVKFSRASDQSACLVLLDIDHFKKINDTYGHPVGDYILKQLTAILQKRFAGNGESVARVGGEEFALLLPDTGTAKAFDRIESLMNQVRAEIFVHDKSQIRFTISAGIAELCSREEFPSWVKRADLALYHSKNPGRNRAPVAPAAVIQAA